MTSTKANQWLLELAARLARVSAAVWQRSEQDWSLGVYEQAEQFVADHGRTISSGGLSCSYYRLGSGPAIVWLTGGLRGAALGFGLLADLATDRTVISLDYPPMRTVVEFVDAVDAIRAAEGSIGACWSGSRTEVSLARLTWRLVRSGPADYGYGWLPAEYVAIGVIRVLPVRWVRRLLGRGMAGVLMAPEGELAEWQDAIRRTLDDLGKPDIVSHFAVAADVIRRRPVTPAAFRSWKGDVSVLAARNDPTQQPRDRRRLETLLGRTVRVTDLGDRGHTAALVDPRGYATLLRQALS